MPTKGAKHAAASTKDIRTFFGNSQPGSTGSQRKASQGTQSGDAIEIADDEVKEQKQKPDAVPPTSTTVRNGRVGSLGVDGNDSASPPKRAVSKRKKLSVLVLSDEEDEPHIVSPTNKKSGNAPASFSESKHIPKSSSAASPEKGLANATALDKKDMLASEMDEEDDDIYEEDLVPTKHRKPQPPIRKGPTKDITASAMPKPEDGAAAKSKFNWAAAKAAIAAGPRAPGSKQIPQPASENCLANLSFVFTGELSSFSREEAVDLAKRYGGRVVGQPSSKTSYVVLGDNAGPSKLAAIQKHKLQALNEDEFLDLIATRVVRDKDLDAKTRKKKEKEQEAIRQAAKELGRREKGKEKEGKSLQSVNAASQLWTTRYAPQTLKEICGNKGQVEKVQLWLHDWSQSLKAQFKKPGKHGMNIFRAILITGPPGIGKTTAAHICAKLEGFTVIELNASDARSKKLIEKGMNVNNTNLDGWVGKAKAVNDAGVVITDKSCIIMDEVDGMSAGDRGGVGALNALIKKTQVPIICIANDRGAQKLKPLMKSTFSLPFRKPEIASIRSRILSIAYKEKLKIPPNVVDQLVEGAQSDIRQVLNMLSTWKLNNDAMDFDEGKTLVKQSERYSIMSPFDITSKMLGPYLFSSTSRETLGDKIELYFHDYSFIPLFIQENYLRTQPAGARDYSGPEKLTKVLELMDKAASSISDGDLVDALIHGPEQHWSLMPLHAVCSAVRPASFMYGVAGGYAGPNAMAFPQWLGQNSKQSKLNRQLSDVQIRMRHNVSGNKTELRQSYLPALFPHIVKPLIDTGSSAVEGVIERMDEYHLSKEDWDAVVELGLDQNKAELVLKKISTATKTHFTKKYNSSDHPIAFHKAQDLGRAPKKIASSSVPDLEEAFDNGDDDAGADSDDENTIKKADDILNDKLVRPAKKGKAKANKTKDKAKQ